MGWALDGASLRAWFFLLCISAVSAMGDATLQDIARAKAELLALPFDSQMIATIERAKTFPIPKRQNQGESRKCGFYALSHVLSHFNSYAKTGHDLFELALDRGWYWSEDGSSLGGHLANVAREEGYWAKSGWGLSGASIVTLKKYLRAGYGLVVAIRDISNDGFPLYEHFFKVGGHFVAVEGFVTLNRKEYLIVKDSRHAWGEPGYVEAKLGGSSLWPVELFQSAWSFKLFVAVKNKAASHY